MELFSTVCHKASQDVLMRTRTYLSTYKNSALLTDK